ncbi:hypothetical protein B0H14DRAFT_3898109, partial [Mycena olivaceomarginata]
MSALATFCSKPLSLSLDAASEKSSVALNWILANGIPAPHSASSGVLTIPSGTTVCSMHIKVSVSPELPYDLVLGRDWLFFCRETLPHSSFTLSSGVVQPGRSLNVATHSYAVSTDAVDSVMDIDHQAGHEQSESLHQHCICDDQLTCTCPSASTSLPSAIPMPILTSTNIIR